MRTPPADVVSAAQLSQEKYGIPASLAIAQWALESGWGQHMPPGSNNPFGMKARPGDPSVTVRTREVIGGRTVYVDAPFRKFASLAEAFEEHGKLLNRPVYAKAKAKYDEWRGVAGHRGPDAFARALTGVYATDPKYGELLISIMAGSDLYRFDLHS